MSGPGQEETSSQRNSFHTTTAMSYGKGGANVKGTQEGKEMFAKHA